MLRKMNKSQERTVHENCKRGGNSRSIFGQALARFGAKDDLVLNRHRQVSQFTTTNLGIIETNPEIPKFLHATLFIYDFNTLTVKHSSNYETERSNKVRSSLIFLESFTFFNIRYPRTFSPHLRQNDFENGQGGGLSHGCRSRTQMRFTRSRLIYKLFPINSSSSKLIPSQTWISNVV